MINVTANSPKSRKAKGRIGQKETLDLIYAFNPELLPGDVRSTSMGSSGVDILLSPRAQEMVPFSIESKFVETFHVWTTWAQAVEHAKNNPGTDPLVTFRRSKHEMLALCRARDFFKILRGFYEKSREN